MQLSDESGALCVLNYEVHPLCLNKPSDGGEVRPATAVDSVGVSHDANAADHFMSSIPTTIPRTSVILGDRARETYTGVEDLASSIEDQGLIEPIVLKALPDGTYLLLGGGRRTAASDHLGITEWHFAKSCSPGKVGFVLADSDFVLEKSEELMVELVENLHRVDLDWREQLKLLVPAYRQKRAEGLRDGNPIFLRTFGKMVGVGYSDIQAAVAIYDEVVENPARFSDCSSLHAAFAMVLSDRAREGEAMLVSATPIRAAAVDDSFGEKEFATDINGLAVELPTRTQCVSLSPFKLGNSLDYLERERPVFDHIICDPDFAIAPEVLDSKHTGNSNIGIAQTSVEDSLNDLDRLIRAAFVSCRSYFVFFYDLDHHEKLQRMCKNAGFLVQRWPITWQKTDYQSNGSPYHNTTKDEEWAMVCRKPEATLATAAPKSVIALPSGTTSRDLGHPFAKPDALWHRLYSYFCRPGQTTFDPFGGVFSSVIPALKFGLRPSAMELQEQHYNRGILNLQDYFRRTDANVQFTYE